MKDIVDKFIATVAYEASRKSANQACWYFFNQPKLPETVKKLRKF